MIGKEISTKMYLCIHFRQNIKVKNLREKRKGFTVRKKKQIRKDK